MGPLTVVGTPADGAALLLHEGSPDWPTADRLWSLVADHQVTTLGVSPTLARALRRLSTPPPGRVRTVRRVGSTGEPWDPDSYAWLARDVLAGAVPVINFSGGTEVGGSFLAPYPVEAIAGCSLGGPSLGMDVAVVDDVAVGVPDPRTGEAVCVVWVPVDDVLDGASVERELSDLVGRTLVRPFTPRAVRRVPALPRSRSRSRSHKLMRGAGRAAVLDVDVGDLSSTDTPGAVDLIRAVVRTPTPQK